MNLHEMLWSKLDLSKFGNMEFVEVFDSPQKIYALDYESPLRFGLGICYSDDSMNNYFLMHASCKHKEACGIVWDIYSEYHKKINEILGVRTAINRVDPARCGNAFSEDIIKKYGGGWE